MFQFYAACLYQFDDICSEFRISIENVSLEDAHLLTKSKDLEALIVSGTPKYAEICEEDRENGSHRTGFIAQGAVPILTSNN
jgi:hypothetical protein